MKELGKYSKDLLKKKELIVFNKIDLVNDEKLKEKKIEFRKKIKKQIIILSTNNKSLISRIKAKLINYVS